MLTMSPLYRNGIQYALRVSEPVALLNGSNEYRVDIEIDGEYATHMYVNRTSHLIADCFDVVQWAIDKHLEG